MIKMILLLAYGSMPLTKAFLRITAFFLHFYSRIKNYKSAFLSFISAIQLYYRQIYYYSGIGEKKVYFTAYIHLLPTA